jgi:hypothetical protein
MILSGTKPLSVVKLIFICASNNLGRDTYVIERKNTNIRLVKTHTLDKKYSSWKIICAAVKHAYPESVSSRNRETRKLQFWKVWGQRGH